MKPDLALENLATLEEFQRQHRESAVTLVFLQIVGSAAALPAFQSLVREKRQLFPDAEEIGAAGDGFCLAFVKPSDAVKFALRVQSALRALPAGAARIGIHAEEPAVGVTEMPVEGEDLVHTCARVVSMAAADQILITRVAFDDAREDFKAGGVEGLAALRWLHHDAYLLKGSDAPVEIFEVGEHGKAPMIEPPDTELGKHYVPPADGSAGKVAGQAAIAAAKKGDAHAGSLEAEHKRRQRASSAAKLRGCVVSIVVLAAIAAGVYFLAPTLRRFVAPKPSAVAVAPAAVVPPASAPAAAKTGLGLALGDVATARSGFLERIALVTTISETSQNKLRQTAQRAHKLGLVASIAFPPGATALADEEMAALRQQVDAPAASKVRADLTGYFVILGYGDAGGDEAQAATLARARADAVLAAMRDTCKVTNVMQSMAASAPAPAVAGGAEKAPGVEVWAILP